MATIVQKALHTCIDHVHKETDMYCKTCKKPVCVQCVSNEHKEHECDSMKNVARILRDETTQRKIEMESISKSIVMVVTEILESVSDNSNQQFSSNCYELESTRKKLVRYVNEKIDKMKAKCEDDHEKTAEIVQEQRDKLKTKGKRMKFLIQEMETGATDFTDFDLIEMHEELMGLSSELQSLAEIPSDLSNDTAYTGGSCDFSIITTLLGSIEEKQSSQNPVLKYKFQYNEKENSSSDVLLQICPMTRNEAWVHADRATLLKLFDSEGKEKRSIDIKCECTDVNVDENDIIYFLDADAKCVKTIDRDGKITSLFQTAPLVPSSICLLRSGNLLLTSAERGHMHGGKILVKIMSRKGDVIKEYEIENYRETSRKFVPGKVIEHFSGNICTLVWFFDDEADEVEFSTIFSTNHEEKMVFKYGDKEDALRIASICCDIKGNTLAAEPDNNRIHVIDARGNLIRYLFTDGSFKTQPDTIALLGCNLWVANWDTKMIEVYNYAT